MKFLIVEDNPSVRRVLRRILSPFGGEILECAEGATALQIYCAERPDYVLMDINLGESDGIAATKEITGFDRNAKVIIVTNFDEKDLRQAADEAGAIGFVAKENLGEVQTFLKP
jgi:CheY-like chemotaxis protein